MAQERPPEKPKHERHDLTGEHRLTDTGQLVLFCLFAAAWIADTFFFRYTTFLNGYVPLAARLGAGAVVLALAAWMSKLAHDTVFGEVREPPAVIRESVFGMVRHPLYLSEIILYSGILIISMSLAAAVVWLAVIAFLHMISRHEERLLLARFGGDYEQYMREVPMWVPRLRRR